MNPFGAKYIFLHEYVSHSHYSGAAAYINAADNSSFSYVEFGWVRRLLRSIQRARAHEIMKALRDISWLLISFLYPSLNKGKFVVIGVAPLDPRLFFLRRIISKSKIVYHSSWTDWGGGNYPKTAWSCLKIENRKSWVKFLTREVRAFAFVTSEVKDQLVRNYGINFSRATIVSHSFDGNFFNPLGRLRVPEYDLTVVFIGRLVAQKGISDILELARKFPTIRFDFVGSGELDSLIHSSKLENVRLLGRIGSRLELGNVCRQSDLVLLPSKRISGWEELFGIALIEAMACGCVPIASSHPGPVEILGGSDLEKCLIDEAIFADSASLLIERFMLYPDILEHLRKASVDIAARYEQQAIARQWAKVFEHSAAEG